MFALQARIKSSQSPHKKYPGVPAYEVTLAIADGRQRWINLEAHWPTSLASWKSQTNEGPFVKSKVEDA